MYAFQPTDWSCAPTAIYNWHLFRFYPGPPIEVLIDKMWCDEDGCYTEDVLAEISTICPASTYRSVTTKQLQDAPIDTHFFLSYDTTHEMSEDDEHHISFVVKKNLNEWVITNHWDPETDTYSHLKIEDEYLQALVAKECSWITVPDLLSNKSL